MAPYTGPTNFGLSDWFKIKRNVDRGKETLMKTKHFKVSSYPYMAPKTGPTSFGLSDWLKLKRHVDRDKEI